jgi:putative peptide zinc metalloprotease protein
MMLITSVNTLFINGNPLMRYDGYYALSDLTGVPNLSAVSRQRLSTKIRGYFLRHTPLVENHPLPRFLLAYAAAAMLYRWLILAAITVGIWTFFDVQQLRSIGYLVVGLVGMIVAVPMLMNIRAMAQSIARQGLRWFNTLVVLVILSGSIYLILGIEFSHRVWGQAEIQLANPDYIFAPADGKFIHHVFDGQTVEAGDAIALIESPELILEAISLAGQLREAQLNLQFIKLKTDSHLLAGQTEQWKKRESTLKRQWIENQRKQQELAILAPSGGRLVAIQSPERPPQLDSLKTRTDSLFASQNQNCQVNRGDPICYVGEVNRMQGLIAVDQQDIDLVKIGQPVKISVPFEPDFISATVVDIAIENQPFDSPNQDSTSTDQTLVTYQVEIEFPADSRFRVGSTRQAVIVGNPTTIVALIRRWLRNSFWF